MIKKGTKIEITDNTGALIGKCIEIYGRKTGKIGSKVLLAIKEEEYSMSGK
jgi:ribosomal protein L14